MLICLQHLSWPHVGYPAMPLAGQLAHQRCVPPNPLVLGREPLKSPTPTADRDRPVSRQSKPSSRTAFIHEQPNPGELLHPPGCDEPTSSGISSVSRGVDYVFFLSRTLASPKLSAISCQLSAKHNLACLDRSRRVARSRTLQAFPFGSVVTGFAYQLHLENRNVNCELTRSNWRENFPRRFRASPQGHY